jgi:hypothetical protein
VCVLSLSHVEHTWTDHLICSLFSARAMHAQQKSSPVSHSIELENITLGLHSVRQIQPRLMLIHHIPERASFCALDASRACFFFYSYPHTHRSLCRLSFIFTCLEMSKHSQCALGMFILYCFALQSCRGENSIIFSCLC